MSKPTQAQIDPRGPRFTASITLVMFAAVLLSPSNAVSIALLAIQAACFTIGAGRGVQFTPTAYVFRALVRPRLAAPDHLEDAAPPRFAQAVGLVFTVVALVGYATGVTVLGQVFAAFALIAATLNAVFAFCLGCELYLLGKRLSHQGVGSKNSTTPRETNKEEVTA
jgi:disulfide bond formation protein DsbB